MHNTRLGRLQCGTHQPITKKNIHLMKNKRMEVCISTVSKRNTGVERGFPTLEVEGRYTTTPILLSDISKAMIIAYH